MAFRGQKTVVTPAAGRIPVDGHPAPVLLPSIFESPMRPVKFLILSMNDGGDSRSTTERNN